MGRRNVSSQATGTPQFQQGNRESARCCTREDARPPSKPSNLDAGLQHVRDVTSLRNCQSSQVVRSLDPSATPFTNGSRAGPLLASVCRPNLAGMVWSVGTGRKRSSNPGQFAAVNNLAQIQDKGNLRRNVWSNGHSLGRADGRTVGQSDSRTGVRGRLSVEQTDWWKETRTRAGGRTGSFGWKNGRTEGWKNVTDGLRDG